MGVLYIIRGLPGSGKSTIAKKLVDSKYHRESDMYRIINGQYVFDPLKVEESHKWCQKEIYNIMVNGHDCAVSNTFTRKWEYQPYIDIAELLDYHVNILECHGPWESIHGIPYDVMEDMKDRWEPYIIK